MCSRRVALFVLSVLFLPALAFAASCSSEVRTGSIVLGQRQNSAATDRTLRVVLYPAPPNFPACRKGRQV